MKDKLIASVRRDIILDSTIRYGLARNVPATDEQGRDVKLCLAVIERDNGRAGCSFDVVGINEDRIRFHGEEVIKEEIMRRVYA